MKTVLLLSLIHIPEPTRLLIISYAVFCLKKKKKTVFYLTDCFCIKSYGEKKWVGKTV